MYGLVNKAIEGMVREAHGEEAWHRIRRKAGVDTEVFVSNEPYPDDVTYRLVAAVSEHLAVPPHQILRAFGEYWVLNTAVKAYGPLMRVGGRTLRDFLVYLPRFHVHVQVMFPALQPPEFACENIGEYSLDLHYRSPRPAGLEPFVEGLVLGLGKMFETPVRIQPLQERAHGFDRTIFHVSWGPEASANA